MSQQDSQLLALQILVNPLNSSDQDELYQTTRDLQTRLGQFDIESIHPMTNAQNSVPGSKGADPVTIGALAVVVAQTLLPKIIEFLQSWSLRNQGQMLKMHVQRGKDVIDVEFSASTDPEKVKQYLESVLASIDKKKP